MHASSEVPRFAHFKLCFKWMNITKTSLELPHISFKQSGRWPLKSKGTFWKMLSAVSRAALFFAWNVIETFRETLWRSWTSLQRNSVTFIPECLGPIQKKMLHHFWVDRLIKLSSAPLARWTCSSGSWSSTSSCLGTASQTSPRSSEPGKFHFLHNPTLPLLTQTNTQRHTRRHADAQTRPNTPTANERRARRLLTHPSTQLLVGKKEQRTEFCCVLQFLFSVRHELEEATQLSPLLSTPTATPALPVQV